MYDNKLNDEELVLLTLAGDEIAYEMLVSRYENTVKAAALSVTRNHAFAEDAAQDAFVTAWLKLGCLREPSKFSSWISRIAKNCAINMSSRWRDFVDICEVENTVLCESRDMSPEMNFVDSEEKSEIRRSVERLPEKVRRTIHMYYFEDLSVREIAEKTGVSESTVKWQLHDGRKKLRKDLSAMNENMNDPFVTKVMKKVEELMHWDFKADKKGFEAVYSDVLADVEQLPESDKKQHALSEVLMRGYMWLTEQRTPETLKKVKRAALLGHNEDVMCYVVLMEGYDIYGEAFILNDQLPFLRENGFKKGVTALLWRLAVWYYEDDREKFDKTLKEALLTADKDDIYYGLIKKSLELSKDITDLSDRDKSMLSLDAGAVDLRRNGETVLCKDNLEFSYGRMYSVPTCMIFEKASVCDKLFYCPGLGEGEVYHGAGDKASQLKCVSKNISVTVPAGKFDGCEVWESQSDGMRVQTTYANGVGIIKQETDNGWRTHRYELTKYTVLGGHGLIPLCEGNTWEYTSDFDTDSFEYSYTVNVSYADEAKAVVSQYQKCVRIKYDENSFTDMMSKMRDGYFIDGTVRDVSDAAERVAALAVTPAEKAYAETASATMKTIINTSDNLNPDKTENGIWNFFSLAAPYFSDGKLRYSENDDFFESNFELKASSDYSSPLLYGNIYGIIENAVDCVWDEKWTPGYKETVRFLRYDLPITADIEIEDAGEIKVKAGSFPSCLKLTAVTTGYPEGLGYFGGKKEFYFSPDAGFIKLTVSDRHFVPVVYELTESNFCPESIKNKRVGFFYPGMKKRFELIDATDGLISNCLFLCEYGDSGKLLMFTSRLGTQKIPEKRTNYEDIWIENLEYKLWNEEKHNECRELHRINNLRLILHFINRRYYNIGAPETAAAWSRQRLDIIKSLGGNGKTPSAWLGKECALTFGLGCQLCGCGRNEEGFDKIEEFLSLYENWAKIPDGELLSFGDELVYGKVKYPKGADYFILEDGRRISDYNVSSWDLGYNISTAIYGMTAEHGWEWFDGARNEKRFKELLERAKELSAKLNK